MEVVVAAGKEVHALTCDAGHVDPIDTVEVHLAERLAVHGRAGDDDSSGHHGLLLCFDVPRRVQGRADESLDGFGVGFGTNDEELVVECEHRVACRDGDLPVVEHA